MKRIGLHGSYVNRNFGDTLILKIINDWIKEYSNDINVVLPFVTSDQESVEIIGKISDKVDINELDGLIFGPGGYFGEPNKSLAQRFRWSIRNYVRHIIWNRKLFKNSVPYAIIGVGVGPVSFAFLRKRIAKLFKNAMVITVRDIHSRNYLIQWGVREDKINVASDVALTLRPGHVDQLTTKPKVAIHIHGVDIEATGKLKDFLHFINIIGKQHELFIIEDEVNQFDNDRLNNIRNVLKRNEVNLPVIKYRNPEALIEELQKTDIIITSKLHVGIVGYALGKKVLSLPVHSKTLRFYEQIKRSEFCIPIANVNSDRLLEAFNMLGNIDNSRNILFDDASMHKDFVFRFLELVYKRNN
ncbi:MAG: polysaccharide pyruvyl transferase family protein [Candidatus Kuenenia stuttgartiensis]|nr:polysaccharide pyruvyl transferase family protein [Candidatus Kuenenia stuttgartiensis]